MYCSIEIDLGDLGIVLKKIVKISLVITLSS